MHSRNLRVAPLLLSLLGVFSSPAQAGVTLLTRDAVVWGRPQSIRIDIGNGMERAGIRSLNGVERPFLIETGSHSVPFDARGIASGVYFYRLEAGSAVMTRKMMVVK